MGKGSWLVGSDFNSFNQSALNAFTQSALKARCGGVANEWVHDFNFNTISANLTPYDMAGFGGNLYVMATDTSGAHKVYKRTGVATYSQHLTSLSLNKNGNPTIWAWNGYLYINSQHTGTSRIYDISTGSLVEDVATNLNGYAPLCDNGSYLFWFIRRTSAPTGRGARQDSPGSWTWGTAYNHSGRMCGHQMMSGEIYDYQYHYVGTSTLTRTVIGGSNQPYNAKQFGSHSTLGLAFNNNATLHSISNFTTGWGTSSPTFSPVADTPSLKATFYNNGVWYAAGVVSIDGYNYFCIYEDSGSGTWTRTYLQLLSALNPLADVEWFCLSGTTMFCCAYDSIFRKELA